MQKMIDSLLTADQLILTIALSAAAFVLWIKGPITAIQSGPLPSRRLATATWVIWILTALFLAIRGGTPIGVRPDSWSDSNIVVSGRNYARDGLLAHAGAAQHQVVTASNPPDPFYYYLRYPVGCNWINGALQLAGITSDRAFRILPALCALLGVLIWRGVFRRLASPSVAEIASMLLCSSYGFLAFADLLHYHAYCFLTSALAVSYFTRGVEPGATRGGRQLCQCAMCIFVTAWLTWEYHLWFGGFVVTYGFLRPSRIKRRWLPIFALPLLAALGLQSLQRSALNAQLPSSGLAATSKTGFLDDVYRRTIGFERSFDTPEGVTLSTYPARVALNFFRMYGVPIIAAFAIALWTLGRSDSNEPFRRTRALAISLIAAGLCWWCVMLQHTSVHLHVMRHMLPAAALIGGLAVSASLENWRSPQNGWNRRSAAAIILAGLLYAHVEGAVTSIRLFAQPTWFDPRGRADEGLAERDNMSHLAQFIPEGGIILTNHVRIPPMRLWANRPVYQAGRWRWPRGDEHGRLQIDLVVSHLVELYEGRLPPVYYVYFLGPNAPTEAFQKDVLFRLMLCGRPEPGADGMQQAQAALRGASMTGRSNASYCEIVGTTPTMICFRLDALLPVLSKMFPGGSPPTAREYGPMP